MAKLTTEIKNAIEKQEIFPVATTSQDNVPNVIYVKYLKVVDDQTILLADNYFGKTRENILTNGNVAFVVLDDEKGSYQVKGKSQRIVSGPMFDEVQKWVPDKLPKEAAVVIQVDQIYNGAELIQ